MDLVRDKRRPRTAGKTINNDWPQLRQNFIPRRTKLGTDAQTRRPRHFRSNHRHRWPQCRLNAARSASPTTKAASGTTRQAGASGLSTSAGPWRFRLHLDLMTVRFWSDRLGQQPPPASRKNAALTGHYKLGEDIGSPAIERAATTARAHRRHLQLRCCTPTSQAQIAGRASASQASTSCALSELREFPTR